MSTLSEHGRQGSSRRTEQKEETLRTIKQAALALFREHGYEATTTKQIAEAAGVAQGTVFLVAPTKEGLLVIVLEEKLREVAASRMETLPAKGVVAQLLHVIEGLFDFFAKDIALSRALVKGMLFFSDPVAKARRDQHVGDFLRFLGGVIERGKSRREIAARADSGVCAANIFAVYVDALGTFLNADRPNRRLLGEAFAARLDALLGGVLVGRRRR